MTPPYTVKALTNFFYDSQRNCIFRLNHKNLNYFKIGRWSPISYMLPTSVCIEV